VPVGDEVLIRVHDQYLGFGGYQDHETKTDYALRDGKLIELVERLNVGKTVGLLELTAEEVRNHPDQKKSLAIDLNLDGQLDDITARTGTAGGALAARLAMLVATMSAVQSANGWLCSRKWSMMP
jgi:hypothetical protein